MDISYISLRKEGSVREDNVKQDDIFSLFLDRAWTLEGFQAVLSLILQHFHDSIQHSRLVSLFIDLGRMKGSVDRGRGV